ncbi:glycosyltransferase family 2 protein [Kineococcus sp. SYSU DK006]|uniref:glycosyltransferase family 2 protein n=1 Tax=Kineococcus sp. SYSU DK006 TaxID=3383127 RepID=UPI003D7C7270
MNDVLEIVIPMAGRGSRFADAGYADPKPLIRMPDGRRMIELVVDNLKPVRPHRFTFVVRAEHRAGGRLDAALRAVAGDCRVLEVPEVTQGAAETVSLALVDLPEGSPLMIANCDQYVDLRIDDYLAAGDGRSADGYMMTMTADDPKWSFAATDDDGWVTRVVEKEVISTSATVGIYNFASTRDFLEGYRAMVAADRRTNGEYYVAPVYNELITAGRRFHLVDVARLGGTMHGIGTPADLDAFVAWSAATGAPA